MKQRGSLHRRSKVEWGVRGAAALVAAILGYMSVTHSTAYPLGERDPARAHALAPHDGRITAALASKLFMAKLAAGSQTPASPLALRALRQDPTAVTAVVTLGYEAQLRGNKARERRLFSYAQALSRRNLQTQLWMIEDAVARSDIPTALRNYDIALRTSKTAPDLLFPVLSQAISERTIREQLVSTLAKRPPWASSFIIHLADNGADPRAIVSLFAGLRRAGVAVSPAASTMAINQLVAANAYDEAWRYYGSLHPGADRRMSRDPQFTADPADASLFDWIPVSDGSVATAIQPRKEGGVFEFSVPASNGGTLLEQVQFLPRGAYRLNGHSIGIEQPEQSLPYWVLTCQNRRELGRVIVPNSQQSNGIFAGRFDVPSDCPVQTLALIARSSNSTSGVTGQIDRVRLVPAGDAER